jgi:hypothetical protein
VRAVGGIPTTWQTFPKLGNEPVFWVSFGKYRNLIIKSREKIKYPT